MNVLRRGPFRFADTGDDRGSLAMALLVTLIGMSMSALLVPVVINQLADTRVNSARTRALHAAEAGMDTAMGQIRAATDAAGAGSRTLLPGGPLTGSAAPDGTQRYQVTFDYRDMDGSSLGTTPATPPSSVLLLSTGVATVSGGFDANTRDARTLQATYTFQTSDFSTIPGGQIHVRSSTTDLCLDAGSAQPVAGTPVTMQSCQNALPQQLFAYNQDLTLTLVSSRTRANPAGMCLEAGWPHAAGAQVILRGCAGTDPPPLRQQWISNDVANLTGTSDGFTPDGFCFNVTNADTAGSLVVLGSGTRCNGAYDNVQTFQPDFSAGAGAAGAPSGQLVSFGQFARCLDASDSSLVSTYLTAWPCRQAIDATKVGWDQKWTLPAVSVTTRNGTGRISVTVAGVDYCLLSPGTAVGAYPTLARCPTGALPAAYSWTVYGATGSFATSYQIVEGTQSAGSASLCLAPSDLSATPPDLYQSASYTGPPISKIVLRYCDGTASQKWNAPANLNRPSSLTSVFERTAG